MLNNLPRLETVLWCCYLRWEGNPNENSAQRIFFSIHRDGRADLQITKRVQTAHIFFVSHSSHIPKVRALRIKMYLKIRSPKNKADFFFLWQIRVQK